MDTKTIINEYLIKNNYDGLYNDQGCACVVNNLMENGCCVSECKAGYKSKCYCDFTCLYHMSDPKIKEIVLKEIEEIE